MEHECEQKERLVNIETDAKRYVPWTVGIASLSAAFGICCLGFLLLHGMVVSDRAEAMSISLSTRTETDRKIERLADIMDNNRKSSEKDIKEILRSQFEIMAAIKK